MVPTLTETGMKLKIVALFGLIAVILIVASSFVVACTARVANTVYSETREGIARQLSKLDQASVETCASAATKLLNPESWLSVPPKQNFQLLKDACFPPRAQASSCAEKACTEV